MVFEQSNNRDICIQVIVCWFLWKNRNDIVWKQRGVSVPEVVHAALSFLNQWKAAQDKNFDLFLSFMTQEDGLEQWCPSSSNSVKVNVDAALFTDPNRYNYAIVVRDHLGHLVQAMSKCSLGKSSPELAESVGIREALSWLKRSSVSNGIVESDCLQVIQLIRSSFSSYSYLGKVMDDCRHLLEDLRSHNVLIRFVKRSANRVAHYLARYSCSIAELKWDMENVHPAFSYVFCKDLKVTFEFDDNNENAKKIVGKIFALPVTERLWTNCLNRLIRNASTIDIEDIAMQIHMDAIQHDENNSNETETPDTSGEAENKQNKVSRNIARQIVKVPVIKPLTIASKDFFRNDLMIISLHNHTYIIGAKPSSFVHLVDDILLPRVLEANSVSSVDSIMDDTIENLFHASHQELLAKHRKCEHKIRAEKKQASINLRTLREMQKELDEFAEKVEASEKKRDEDAVVISI
ncbi:hypothetical protein AgCh_039448 [Apium graveolens]